MCPLLIEIVIEGDKQLFSLKSDEYSAYSYEEEVLLQDGVEYTVINCEPVTEIIKRGNMTFERKLTLAILSMAGTKYQKTNCCVKSFKLLTN